MYTSSNLMFKISFVVSPSDCNLLPLFWDDGPGYYLSNLQRVDTH